MAGSGRRWWGCVIRTKWILIGSFVYLSGAATWDESSTPAADAQVARLASRRATRLGQVSGADSQLERLGDDRASAPVWR